MGAALTAVTPRVLEMLDRRAKQKTDITEQELQAIAKAMYEERLAEVCTLQRSTPYDVENHSAANLALVDYFERLKNQGGHMSFLPGEERKLEAEGWSAQRIVDLRRIIAMREERGIDPIRQEEIDRHLAAAGFAVDDRLRWMLELALYPAYRDVYAAAEAQLRGAATPGRWRLAVRPRLHRHRSPFRSLAFIRRRSVPHQRWRTTGCIAPRPRQRADHRHDAPTAVASQGRQA